MSSFWIFTSSESSVANSSSISPKMFGTEKESSTLPSDYDGFQGKKNTIFSDNLFGQKIKNLHWKFFKADLKRHSTAKSESLWRQDTLFNLFSISSDVRFFIWANRSGIVCASPSFLLWCGFSITQNMLAKGKLNYDFLSNWK